MDKKYYLVLITGLVALGIFLVWFFIRPSPLSDNQLVSTLISPTATPLSVSITTPTITITEVTPNITNDFVAPLDRADERVTKKKFGQYITPQNSPIRPERFSGYHTGVDFEIFPEETDEVVAVRAICSGSLMRKETVGGYGGVVIQSCTLDGVPITVLYGHIKLASISQNVGDILAADEAFAVLGDDSSADTDRERKHLHLGIHRGSAVNVKGYVSNSADLSGWVDPCDYLCQN